MPTFGVPSTYGLTAPAGYAQEASQDSSIDVATLKDTTGTIVAAQKKKLVTITTTVKSKGETDLVSVYLGAISSTKVVTSSKVSESNEDFPTSEVTSISYE
jgi:hypothetical protein